LRILEENEMDIKEFYKSVEDIVLYPGSIDELNKIISVSGRKGAYELMPQQGNILYVTGVIIPTIPEMKKGLGIAKNITESLAMFRSQDLDLGTERLEEMMNELYMNPAMLSSDIRVAAKEIGANGLIHFQLFSKEDLYIGVPVKKR
jgi:hypothetical protein